MSIFFIGCGTIGKTIGITLGEQFRLYRREPIPIVNFDSEDGTPLPALFGSGNGHIDLSIDGIDVAKAMKQGEFGSMRFISQSDLKSQNLTQAMGLRPEIGEVASQVHLPEIRSAVIKPIEITASGGHLKVIRAHSSFGGTSRGAADKINEILWDVSRGSGMRIEVMDIVAIPGLSTASSNFNSIYQRNTYAYIKEISALRTGRFLRHVYSDNGSVRCARHEFLPHTLILINDIHPEKGMLPLDILLPTIAGFIERLTREEFLTSFQGVVSDLKRHETRTPYADRFGLNTLYTPNREEKVAKQQEISIQALNRILEAGTDRPSMAKMLLEKLGVRASEVEQLSVWRSIKGNLYGRLGMDPVQRFRELYSKQADDYLFEYETLKTEIEAVDTEEIGGRILDSILKQDFSAKLGFLKRNCPPAHINMVLNDALMLLEKEKDELEASVCGDDAGILSKIEEFEEYAGFASRNLSKRWKRKKDALLAMKSHLLSALDVRVKAASLRILYAVISGLHDAIVQDEVQAWKELEREAQDMIAALTEVLDELKLSESTLKNNCFRGNASPVKLRSKTDFSGTDSLVQRLNAGLGGVIGHSYGRPVDSIKQEVSRFIKRNVDRSLESGHEQLSRRQISRSFKSALKCSLPPLVSDMTSRTYRRAVFCLSPLECNDLVEKAIADTGIHVDRQIYGRLRGINDEMSILMYDKGVPLASIRALQECRDQYMRDDERYMGHLQPLFELLPDPLGVVYEDIYLLMGLVTGSVAEAQDSYTYIDLEGISHTVNDTSFFTEYERAVEIASKFIVYLKEQGFDSALQELGKIKAAFKDAPELEAKLERFAEIYGE